MQPKGIALLAFAALACATAAAQIPGTPTGFAPDGWEDDAVQQFAWTAVPGATRYEINIREMAGVAAVNTTLTVLPSEANCASEIGLCVYSRASPMVTGRYQWQVTAVNAAGRGQPSPSLSMFIGYWFDVNFPPACALPSAPGWTNAPAGATAGWMATQTFSSEGNCALMPIPIQIGTVGSAQIEFNGSFRAGNIVFDAKVSSGTGCLRFKVDGVSQPLGGHCGSDAGGAAGEVPMFANSIPVSAGPHRLTWSYEQDASTTSNGVDSAWIDNVQLPLESLPAAPTLLDPVAARSATLKWTAVPGADNYSVVLHGFLYHFAGGVPTSACAAGTCSFTITSPFPLLADGLYYYGVRAGTLSGAASPFSLGTFTVTSAGLPPLAVETIAPNGLLATTTPAYSWYGAQNATSYTLLAQNTGGVLYSIDYDPAAIGCATTPATCSAQPTVPLVLGANYSWFVRANNSAGSSPWSAPRAITAPVAPPPPPPPLPGTPTVLAPIGLTGTVTPTFSWTPASAATQYDLNVRPTSGTSYLTTVMASSCTTTCTATLPAALVNGMTYTWTVVGMNSSGFGPVSAPGTFNIVAGPVIPAAPVTISPTGTIDFTTTPTFSWVGVPGAASYYVLVQNTAGVAIGQSIAAPAANCTPVGNICTLNSPVALANGSTYNWFVNATNGAGTGPWSATRTFTISLPPPPPGPPATPVTISPTGVIQTDLPTYSWNALPDAQFYRLLVTQSGGPFIGLTYTPAEVGCAAGTGTCSATPTTRLTLGVTYEWMVGASNSYGPSNFSATRSVTASGLSAVPPETIYPTGNIPTGRPIFSWNAIPGATGYSLLVQNTQGVFISQRFTASEVACDGTAICSIVSPATLPAGNYNWFVNASAGTTTSDWSAPRAFMIVPPPPEAFPANCMLPTAADGWRNPPTTGSFTGWSVATDSASEGACSLKSNPLPDGATARIEFAGWFNAGILSFDRRVSSEYNLDCLRFYVDDVEQNIGGTCLARGGLSVGGEVPWGTVSFSMPAGFHTLLWSYDKNGNSTSAGADAAWIDKLVMPLQAPLTSAPAAPVGRRPDGTAASSTPTYDWTAVPGATSYRLQVQNTSGVAYSLVYTAAEAQCDHAALCRVTPSTPLATAQYNWFVQASNSYGAGAWSDARMVNYTGTGYPQSPVDAFPPACSIPTVGWTNGVPFNDLAWFVDSNFSSEGFCSLKTPHMANQFGALRARIQYTGTFTAGMVSFDRKLSSTPGVACLHFIIDGVMQPIGGTCGMGPGVSGESSWTMVSVPISAGTHTVEWFFEKSLLGSDTDAAWIDNLVMPVDLPAPSTPGVIFGPTGQSTPDPRFGWEGSANADRYQIVVRNSTGVTVADRTFTAASALCAYGIGICGVSLGLELINGDYTWSVRALNAMHASAFSAPTAFFVQGPQPPGSPVTVSPTGTVNTLTPAYTWNAIAGATSYYLLVQNTAGVAVGVSYTAAAAGCGAGTGTCSVTPSSSLGNGAVYNWFVSATNGVGTGPWSAATTITVSAAGPGIPAPPSALYLPSVTTDTLTPRYLWSASPGATSYELIVQNTAGVAANLTVTSEVAHCPSGSCDITPPGALTNGATYNWFVRATNNLGTSAWSAPNTFTVSAIGPGVPAAPVLMGPSGVASSATPIFVWEEVSGATGYSIVVQNTAGVVFYQVLGTATCLASFPTATCAAQPPAPLPSGTYNWFVSATNSYGTGPWSSARTLTIP
jgi:hypothetical protein